MKLKVRNGDRQPGTRKAHLMSAPLSRLPLRRTFQVCILVSSAAAGLMGGGAGVRAEDAPQRSQQPKIIILGKSVQDASKADGSRPLVQRWLHSCAKLPIIDVALQFGCLSTQVLFGEGDPSQSSNASDPKLPGQRQKETATFNMSARELVARYDAQLKKDGDSGLSQCEVEGAVWACRFDTASFNKSLALFKQADLMNGPFELKTMLEIHELDGKVARISIQGVRSDPVNLFVYSGQVLSMVRMFEPELTDGGEGSIGMNELGLMRGDSDPTIGTEKTIINHDFAVQCIQYNSSVSVKMECAFDPRS